MQTESCTDGEREVKYRGGREKKGRGAERGREGAERGREGQRGAERGRGGAGRERGWWNEGVRKTCELRHT